MACHLTHKLPWASLLEIALRRPVPDPEHPARKTPLTPEEEKKIDHFARCLAAAMDEFRSSDRSSDEERAMYDPYTWHDQRPHGAGAWIGFYESIPMGYVVLNLLLADPENIAPRIFYGRWPTYTMSILLGRHDGGHPDEFADHLKQAFDGDKLKLPMTAETAQVLRDHAAMMFRCMYSVRGAWPSVEGLADSVKSAVLHF